MQPTYVCNGNTHLVTPLRRGRDFAIAVDGHTLNARIHWHDANTAELSINGATHTVHFAQDDKKLFVHLGGRVWQLTAIDEFGAAHIGSDDGDGAMLAPMPGVVVEVNVSIGQRVKAGDMLMLIESMKLQSEIKAKIDGVVSRVNVSAGASFERNSVLAEITAVAIDADAAAVEGEKS